jgi:hypothetical protein
MVMASPLVNPPCENDRFKQRPVARTRYYRGTYHFHRHLVS